MHIDKKIVVDIVKESLKEYFCGAPGEENIKNEVGNKVYDKLEALLAVIPKEQSKTPVFNSIVVKEDGPHNKKSSPYFHGKID